MTTSKHQIIFTLYGARIGVQTNTAASLKRLVRVFPPNWRVARGKRADWIFSVQVVKPTRAEPQPTHLLYSNDECVTRGKQLDLLVDAFEREMQLAVAQCARRKTFVHAGVVGWRGRAIVIPGRTYSGKSTLVRELVRAGAVYYSDEYAVLDDKGRVHPFARPLALRDETKQNRKLSFRELGGVIGTKPLPVGTVLAVKFREGAKWRPRALTPGIGVLELLANTVTARTHQELVLETLARVAQHAQLLKGMRGDARAFAAQLLEQLDARA